MQAVAVVKATSDFAAVFKPGEVHTQNQATSSHPSLEQVLPALFPGQKPELLNRLDKLTSGVVLVGLHLEAGLAYKQMQEEGQTAKTYLALVHGRLVEEKCVRNFLQTAKRRKVRVMDNLEPDPLRWTTIRPMGYMSGEQASLVQAGIYKGRRHQIRAHLAACGHPVKGDTLYGPEDQGLLFLHHWKISFPGFAAHVDPDWEIAFQHFLFQGGL
jgi:23S rRNA pseudouridine1911/1915/1917 synthase